MNEPSDSLVHVVGLGYCRWCARPVRTDSFRDALSLREYQITAACQRCQDALFLEASDRDPPIPGSMRHGTIVGAVLDGASLRDVALLPFEFVVRRARIEWEPRHIVCAGAALEPVDPWVELGAMRDAWPGHYVQILNLASFSDPLLSVRLSTSDFVVALDPASLEVIGHLFPSATQRPLAALSADVPWRDAFGVALLPLTPFLRAHGLGGAVGAAAACAARCFASVRSSPACLPCGSPRPPTVGARRSSFSCARMRGGSSRRLGRTPMPRRDSPPAGACGLPGDPNLVPWRSAPAREHPADHNTDDLRVGRPVDADGLVPGACAFCSELHRAVADSVAAPQYDLVPDARGDHVSVLGWVLVLALARKLQRDDPAVGQAGLVHGVAAYAQAQIGHCPEQLPQELAVDPLWLPRLFVAPVCAYGLAYGLKCRSPRARRWARLGAAGGSLGPAPA